MQNDLLDVTLYVNIDPENPSRFNGLHGRHFFKDGRSVEPLTLREALRIGGVVRCVDDDGLEIANGNYEKLIAKHKKAPEPLPELEEQGETDDDKKAPEPSVEQTEDPPAKQYTQEELEAIADKKGIAGLREIADPLNLKARSIPELIKEILASQLRVTH